MPTDSNDQRVKEAEERRRQESGKKDSDSAKRMPKVWVPVSSLSGDPGEPSTFYAVRDCEQIPIPRCVPVEPAPAVLPA